MKILMNHLPKCAGNAVALHFKTLFGESGVYEIRPDGKLENVPDLNPYAFVYGHLPLAWDRALGQGRQMFSLMRNPVERVLSAYFFFASLKERNSPIVANVGMMSLEEYVTSEDPRICRTTCNEQSRQLVGLQGKGPRDQALAQKFVDERVGLLDRFATIGVYERFQESLDMLSWTLILPRFRGGVMANRTPRDWHGEKISPRVREIIAERNQVDGALYRLVSDRFARQSDMMHEEFLSANYYAKTPAAPIRPFQVDFGGPVPGSGWNGVQADAQGAFRWMGGRDGASLYFPVPSEGALTVQVNLAGMAGEVAREDITAFLDGLPMRCTFETGADGRVAMIARAEAVPFRKGHVFTLFTKTWREPVKEDGRRLALAVSGMTLRQGQ